MPATHPLRIAVVGAGAFGRNHLRVYRELERAGQPVQIAAIIDSDPLAAARAATDFEAPSYPTVAAALAAQSFEAASICVPTKHHAAAAETLLAASIDLLIEKPLAATLPEADRILALAAQHGRIVQPGHLERFNPAVTAARQHLNRPMFFEAHRLSVFTPRSLDVDVVLDLMIHDLDIVLSLVDSPVHEVRAVGLPVLSRKVDIANVRLEFASGSIANFTASRVSTERVRKLRFFQPRQYLSLDFARQDLLIIDAPDLGSLDPASVAALIAAQNRAPDPASHPSAGLGLRKIAITPGEPLRLEIEAFLESIRTRTTPQVTAQGGRDALALALDINQAIAEHTKRTGLDG